MRWLVAYSPALVLVAVGLVAGATIPPATHLTSCCPEPRENVTCPACESVSMTYPGFIALVAAWVSALGYAFAMFGLRRWSSIPALQPDF